MFVIHFYDLIYREHFKVQFIYLYPLSSEEKNPQNIHIHPRILSLVDTLSIFSRHTLSAENILQK